MVVLGRRWLARKAWLTEKPEPLIILPPWAMRWFKKKKAVPLP